MITVAALYLVVGLICAECMDQRHRLSPVGWLTLVVIGPIAALSGTIQGIADSIRGARR